MSYYYHYIYLPNEEDDYEERLVRQLEYENRQGYYDRSGKSPERSVRNKEAMPF